MTRLSTDYGGATVAASKAALLELALTLRAYREALVLVGGWVPYFLLEAHAPPQSRFRHVGSIDIDFVVDPEAVGPHEYSTIVELLRARGWLPWEKNLFSFVRPAVGAGAGAAQPIRVDFLTSEPSRLSGNHRHRAVQSDLKARTMRGAPLALNHRMHHRIAGELPGGGETTADLQMADVVGCVSMKGLALGSRYSEKDAYDLYAVVENYGKGPAEVAAALRPFRSDPLVAEAVGSIRAMFANPKAAGPVWVAQFLGAGDPGARQKLAVRAFEVVAAFLEELSD